MADKPQKHRLIVKNFGPIKEADIEIDDLMLLIGPQASGKSTLARLVYFFKEVREKLESALLNFADEIDVHFVMKKELTSSGGESAYEERIMKIIGFDDDETVDNDEYEYEYGEYEYDDEEHEADEYSKLTSDEKLDSFFEIFKIAFKDDLISDFKAKFPEHLYSKNTEVTYHYGGNKIALLSSRQATLFDGIEINLYFYANKLLKRAFKLFESFESLLEFTIKDIPKGQLLAEDATYSLDLVKLRRLLNTIFNDSYTCVYLPAGRIIATTTTDAFLMEQSRRNAISHAQTGTRPLGSVSDYYDVFLDEFLRRVFKMRAYFQRNPELDSIIEQSSNDILKGRYQSRKDGEQVVLDETKEAVPLIFASSGQQEALRILLELARTVNEEEQICLFIEEPEAHLYPTAQKNLVEAMAYTLNHANSEGVRNQLFITTHSPYILTAFNNLIRAAGIASMSPERAAKVDKVVPKHFRIDPERVGAYFMHADGTIESIWDDEENAIGAHAIDEVSEELSKTFDHLLDIEFED